MQATATNSTLDHTARRGLSPGPGRVKLARGRRLSVLRCQAGKLSTDSLQQTKQKLASLAGKKYGHDLSDKQKQEVDILVKQLEKTAPRQSKRPELAGSNWELLYTTSQGSSGGRVGPFVGKVDQVCYTAKLAVMQSGRRAAMAGRRWESFLAGLPKGAT